MRRALLILPLVLALAVPLLCHAQGTLQPPKLEPLPEPPRAPGVITEAPGESPVQIIPGPNDQFEEFVVDGRRVVKVTTSAGAVYYLKDDTVPGTQNSFDPSFHVPLWQIFAF